MMVKQKNLHFYMHEAIIEAEKALQCNEVPIGAVIVHNDTVIGRGFNQKEKLKDPTAHAEMIAIRQAAEKLGSWRLENCTLFVTAEPCPMCMGAIIQAHIPKLVYGTAEKRFGSVETVTSLGQHPMLSKNFEVYAGICETECAALLNSFFARESNRQ